MSLDYAGIFTTILSSLAKGELTTKDKYYISTLNQLYVLLPLLQQPFYNPLSGTIQVSWYLKGQPFWILLKQR